MPKCIFFKEEKSSIYLIFQGKIIKQDFYVSKMKNSLADLFDPTNVLYLYGNPHGLREALSNKKNQRIRGNQTFCMFWISRQNIRQTKLDPKLLVYDHVKSSDRFSFYFTLNDFNIFLVNR